MRANPNGQALLLLAVRRSLITRETSGHYELRELGATYNAHSAPENIVLSTGNTYSLDLTIE